MLRIILFIALSISNTLLAQNISGRVKYQSTTPFRDSDFNFSTSTNPELDAQLQDVLKKSFEKTYILEFTKEESFFQEEEKLEQPTTNGGHSFSILHSSSDSGNLYRNLKEKYAILENDFLGKTFYIKDSIKDFGWELTSETKKIGNYTVYKAIKVIPAENTLDSIPEKEFNSNGNFTINIASTPKDVVYIAWYTPEIPIATGPETYGGLPGLILELHTPSRIYLCEEITLNPKKPIKIKAPKGKTISQKEYDKLIEEKISKQGNGNSSFQTITITK